VTQGKWMLLQLPIHIPTHANVSTAQLSRIPDQNDSMLSIHVCVHRWPTHISPYNVM